MLFLQLSG